VAGTGAGTEAEAGAEEEEVWVGDDDGVDDGDSVGETPE
jgi:hypothetical protein